MFLTVLHGKLQLEMEQYAENDPAAFEEMS